ncbi:SCO family protein [Roseomonas sp. NAR14]|uniref:SCO family protein n=2 Tax=Roseomonas acroporae TaxID=2937791 RepID=A0A9X1Y3S3_9PROT|nr:SCO family protein [Roseomonas acroporae]MCK8783444.1 SCO family protein [Roseomonas acroporae]
MRRWGPLFGAACLLIALGFGAAAWLRRPAEAPGFGSVAGEVTLPGGVNLGGPFTLVNQDGRTVTDRDYRGRWTLMTFGYTFCPDVCPTELATIASALDALDPALAERVQPVFVSIDPARDTPEHLKQYVALFHPRLVGLTGTPEQVAAAARAYRVYYAKARGQDTTEYLMDHSSFMYLIGPDGTVRALFQPGVTPEQLAEALRRRAAQS